jgi:hypothetical protein
MPLFDWALAVFLLTSPPDVAAARQWAPLVAAVRPALLHAGRAAEIVDHREQDHVANPSEGLAGELNELQTRFHALGCAPRLAECMRFPPKRRVDDWVATNRTYRAALEARLAVDPIHAEALRRAIAETDELYRVWSLLRVAQSECYYIHVRRRALLELREELGIAAFCRAQLPPHLPVWHFPEWR